MTRIILPSGAGGGVPSGAAGGALGGTYPNPTIDYLAQAAFTPANDPLFPTFVAAAKSQNMRRIDAATNTASLATGRLNMTLCPVFPGLLISKITFMSGATAANTPLNQWFNLCDAATRALLAITADDTTTPWGTSAAKTLTLASPYTIPAGVYSILAGICVVATTCPSLVTSAGATGAATGFVAATPMIVGNSSTGLTNPASCPNPIAALTQSAGPAYVIFS